MRNYCFTLFLFFLCFILSDSFRSSLDFFVGCLQDKEVVGVGVLLRSAPMVKIYFELVLVKGLLFGILVGNTALKKDGRGLVF